MMDVINSEYNYDNRVKAKVKFDKKKKKKKTKKKKKLCESFERHIG